MYKALIKKNDKVAMFKLALIYSSHKYIKKNLQKTHRLLQRASILGNHKATYYLGKLYLSKKSFYYNQKKAYNMFLESSNNLYAPAQNKIGEFLLKGIVIKKDYVLAVKYFEKASKQGYINAQCNLAFMYANGKGVSTNFGRAHTFAKNGYLKNIHKCKKVWYDFNLYKYKKDKAWRFNFYTKP